VRVLDDGIPAEQCLPVVIDVPVLEEGTGLRAAVLRALGRVHPVKGGPGLRERQQGGMQVFVLGAAVAALFESAVEEGGEAGFLTPVG
jgi:hypothetical protein